MNPRADWQILRRSRPTTPEAFMAKVYECVPNVTEWDILMWQRSMKTTQWERDLCDFIWACMHAHTSPQWQQYMHQQWPAIRHMIQDQNLEEAFASLGI